MTPRLASMLHVPAPLLLLLQTLTMTSVHFALAENGLRFGAFQGYDHITEVACTGEPLDSDTDLLSMVLYKLDGKKVIATVNLKNNECSTSDKFSSCVIDSKDSHKTRLTTLILDLAEPKAGLV
nr:hypothetical protein BaRGS_016548 [Batillaria attramentaria]